MPTYSINTPKKPDPLDELQKRSTTLTPNIPAGPGTVLPSAPKGLTAQQILDARSARLKKDPYDLDYAEDGPAFGTAFTVGNGTVTSPNGDVINYAPPTPNMNVRGSATADTLRSLATNPIAPPDYATPNGTASWNSNAMAERHYRDQLAGREDQTKALLGLYGVEANAPLAKAHTDYYNAQNQEFADTAKARQMENELSGLARIYPLGVPDNVRNQVLTKYGFNTNNPLAVKPQGEFGANEPTPKKPFDETFLGKTLSKIPPPSALGRFSAKLLFPDHP